MRGVAFLSGALRSVCRRESAVAKCQPSPQLLSSVYQQRRNLRSFSGDRPHPRRQRPRSFSASFGDSAFRWCNELERWLWTVYSKWRGRKDKSLDSLDDLLYRTAGRVLSRFKTVENSRDLRRDALSPLCMISGTVLCLLYPSANWGMIVGGFGALRFLKNLIKVELNERPDRIYRKLPVSTHGFLLRCQTEARAFRTLLRSPPVRVRKRQFGDGEEEEEGGAHTSTHWEERETNEGRSAASDSSSSTSSSAGGTNTRIYETHELASQVLRIADTHARVADFMSSPLKCITSNSTGHQMTSGGITVTMVSVYLEGKGEEAAKVQAIALNRDIVLLVFLPMHVVNPLWLFPEGASLDISPAEPDCAHYMRQAAFRLENLFLAADGEFREAFREAARGFDAIRMMDLFGLGRVFGL